MVLYIDEVELKEVPASAEGIYELSPRLESQASSFSSIGLKKLEAKDVLYVGQREFAVCDGNRDDGFTWLGTDDCTSCLAFIVRDIGTGVNGIAHLDSPVCDISGVITRVQQLSTKILETEKERGQEQSDFPTNRIQVQLVGSFNNTGRQIIASVLRAMSKHPAKLELALCCIGKSNTIIRESTPYPAVYGVGIDRVTGEVFPAHFPEKGPDMALRTVRTFTGEKSLLEIYDFERKLLKLGPFTYSSIPRVKEFLTQTDEKLVRLFSTTPEVEPPHFVETIRSALAHWSIHPSSVTVFKGGKPRLYKYFQSPAFNLSGLVLFWAVSRCMEAQNESGEGSMTGGRGIDEFVMLVVNEYFTDSKQVVLIYDESWEISDMIQRLGSSMTKSFVLYFMPLDPALALRVTSHLSDHPSHKKLVKPNSFVVFCKNQHAFANVLELMAGYPWWNIRAKFLIMVKGKSLVPSKEILTLLESERIFSGIVVTEFSSRDNSTTNNIQDKDGDSLIEDGTGTDGNITGSVGLQLAALNPYPPPGQPSQYFVGRYYNGKIDTENPIFIDKTDNLQSFKLRVCVFQIAPLVIKMEPTPGNFEYTGLEVTILKELANYMNFTYEIYEPNRTERVGTVDANGTWNGLIGQVASNKAQIGFGSVFLLDNRESVVDVTDPYDQDRGCFAVPRPEALQHWLGLVLPFSWQVWACFLAMALIAGPIFSGITRPLKMDASITIGRGIMYALGSMVSAQHAPKAKSSALRSFIVSWLVFCWLSTILYRVALIVSLTIGPNDYKIDTVEQLAQSGLDWGGYEEVVKTFANTSDRSDQRLLERFFPTTNISEALDRVAIDGDFAVMEGGKYLQYASKVTYFNGYTSALHIMKECPTTYNVGLVMPIGSPYYERVNVLLRRFQNSGLVEKWLRDIIYEGTIKNPNRLRGRPSYGLTIDHLKLCFVLVLFGNFFGFVTCCIETCIAAYYAKREVSRMRKNSRLSQLTGRSHSVTPSILVSEVSDG